MVCGDTKERERERERAIYRVTTKDLCGEKKKKKRGERKIDPK